MLISRTRRFGVLLAFAFHTALSISFPAFQFLVIGYLVLFVPEPTLQRVISNMTIRMNALAPGVIAILRRTWVRIALGMMVVIASGEFWSVERTPAHARIFDILTYGIVVFLTLSAALVFYVARIIRSDAWRNCGRLSLLPRGFAVLYLLPIAVFLQGLQPHLGSKSVQSFAMFSNLDTEDGQSNHYLIPASWQISNNLSDSVRVHRSSPDIRALLSQSQKQNPVLEVPRQFRTMARRWRDPTARHAPQPPPPVLRISFLELRRVVTRLSRAGASGLQIHYSHHGKRRHTKNAEREPVLTNASFVERIYLRTRPIAKSSHGSCRW